MTKLNFRINQDNSFLYDQVTTQITPIQERQSSPAHPRSRTASGASSSFASSKSTASGSIGPLYSEIEMQPGNYFSKRKKKTKRRGKRSRTARAATPDESYANDDNNDLYFNDEISSSSSSSSDSLESLVEQQEREYSANERLLLVAFVSFMSFSLTQMYFAFRAESEAMKGDSAAMIVDSFTYLFNWIAERQKHNFDRIYPSKQLSINNLSVQRAQQIRQRLKRKATLQWEILPPLVSVSTLLVVTAVVLRQALRVIWLDLHRNPALQSDPNIDLMMMFALVNLGLDGVNFCCFAQASHLCGYDTTEQNYRHHHRGTPSTTVTATLPSANGNHGHATFDYSDDFDDGDDEEQEYDDDDDDDFMREHHRHNHHANLNMCSAYTHVFADTLRSVAVILAAALAEIFDDVTAEEADAAAALVVSLLILLSLVPLFQGLVQSGRELWAIRAEERSEAMMQEIKQEERKRRDNFWNAGRGVEEEWTG